MIMKKVLLVTLQGANVGNRLQNYALMEILKLEGFQVYNPCLVVKGNYKNKIKKNLKIFLYHLGVRKFKENYIWDQRDKKYKRFSEKFIDNLFDVDCFETDKINSNDYDYAITGSDQVWHNWYGIDEELKYYYLEFMPKEKRIAYAPSFGFDEFPQKDRDLHIAGLNGINRLSCREESGVALIKKETGRDAKLVVDPTLLLNKEQWLKIKKESPLYKKKPFVLVYFLGFKTDDYKNAIGKVAERENLDVLDIYDMSLESLLTTPDEFIWLIDNASYVLTDSFHASLFSIMFGKKFMTFKRCQVDHETMFNRIETLLSMFELKDHIYDGTNIDKVYEEYKTADIENVVKESRNYLKEAIGN